MSYLPTTYKMLRKAGMPAQKAIENARYAKECAQKIVKKYG